MNEINCYLCGSTKIHKLFDTFDYWYNRSQFTAIYYECNNCGLIFQFPIPPKENILNLYPGEYVNETTVQGLFFKRGLRNRCRIILGYKRHGQLLDIGCSTGEFIRAMRDWYHWEVTGVEIDPKAAQIGKAIYDLNIIAGDYEDIILPDNSYDVITLWDVLEHLPQPDQTLRKVRALLKPDGILVIRIPNADSWDAMMFNQYWAGYDPPRHMYVFRKQTLKNLLTLNGFRVKKNIPSVGSYLNFVKSIKFFLTAKKISPQIYTMIVAGLSCVPARIIAIPFTKLKDQFGRGTSMTIIATKQ